MYVFKTLEADKDLIEDFAADGILFDKANMECLENIQLSSVKTKHIECIVGRNEMISILHKAKQTDLKNYNVISITEPFQKKADLNFEINCNDLLQLEFTDIRKKVSQDFLDINSTVIKEISTEQIEQITEFILKNKDKKFIINCDAGISRSAAIGIYVEILLGNEEEIKNILNHYRYTPNPAILDKLKNFNSLNPNHI